MPEEVIIALIIVLVVGWIAFAVIKTLFLGITTAVDSATKELSSFLGATRRWIFERRKAQLRAHVRIFIPNDIKQAESELSDREAAFRDKKNSVEWISASPIFKEIAFRPFSFKSQAPATRGAVTTDLERILSPGVPSWKETEEKLISQQCVYPEKLVIPRVKSFSEFNIPPISIPSAVFEVDADATQQRSRQRRIAKSFSKELDAVIAYNRARENLLSSYKALTNEISNWNLSQRDGWLKYKAKCEGLAKAGELRFQDLSRQYETACLREKSTFSETIKGFGAWNGAAVIRRIEYILGSIELPLSVPRFWNVDYDESEQILIVEIALPDVINNPPVKTVTQKTGPVDKPLNQTERRELVPKFQPAIMLRVAYELLRNDDFDTIKLLALNGWVEHIDPLTGRNTKTYTACLMVTAQQMSGLALENLEPLAAFHALKGKSAGKLVEIIPIEPTLNLSKMDSRFVDGRIVLDGLAATTNLAAIDWQDFEHLIRELFEREFSASGAEVKITQASRDRGVDAIAFDPDPIKGGKFVIQAKRYTNVVDVSAVRDLCAVVRKEGASRGILVTTSNYGADAYEFANNEPVTLLNGAQLLGLLMKHGYHFRIDLAEARRLKAAAGA